MTAALTQTEQVLKVLRAGGYIVTSSAMPQLYDAGDEPRDAWYTAIQNALKRCGVTVFANGAAGAHYVRWELRR